MNEDLIIMLGGNALKTTAMLASPLLIGALVTGLIVSVFQAITQINEATLSFIPKMMIVALIIVIAGPWMLDLLKNYTLELFENMHIYVRQ
jgi:flagellar biosynthesis protein FliQ